MKVNREQDFSNNMMCVRRSDNSGELLTQSNRANSLDNQGRYQEALKILEEVCQKQKETLLPESPFALSTRNNIP